MEDRIHACKQAVPFPPFPFPGLYQPQPDDARTRALQLAHVLRAVPAAARHGELVIGLARDRVERAALQQQGRPRRVEAGGAIQLHGPPARVLEDLERLAREDPRDLMLAVAVARRAREDRHHDLRPEPPDHVQHVGQQRVARPEPKRFLGRLGVAEIERAREELAGAVELASGEELLGADDAELGAELLADEVLAALTPRERQVGGLDAHATGQQREELRVLVVGVGADHEHALVRAQLAQGARQRRDAAGAGRGELPQAGADGADTKREATPERAPHYFERYTTPPFITNRTRSSSVMSLSGSPCTATRSA